jgi:transcriptional regulator with XRE-family HTH domain
MNVRPQVSKALQDLKNQRFTAVEIARKLNVTEGTVRNWISEASEPSASELWDVAELTNKNIVWFYGDATPTVSPPTSSDVSLTNTILSQQETIASLTRTIGILSETAHELAKTRGSNKSGRGVRAPAADTPFVGPIIYDPDDPQDLEIKKRGIKGPVLCLPEKKMPRRASEAKPENAV